MLNIMLIASAAMARITNTWGMPSFVAVVLIMSPTNLKLAGMNRNAL
jgi:hypothetical protein